MNGKKMKIIEIFPLSGYPIQQEFKSIGENIIHLLRETNTHIQNGDIFVIAHKIVSKSEGRVIDGSKITPTSHAIELATHNGFDPIQVELALQESREILRTDRVLITVTKSGLVCNFAGVDKSNVQEGYYVLLPEYPDKSAERIMNMISQEIGKKVGVIISDTQGRPWRKGSVNIAIGSAGIDVFKYNKGKTDLHGRELKRSTVCQIDEIAAAAEPMMGQGAEGTPIVIVRGYDFTSEHTDSSADILRDDDEDLFR